MIRLRLCALVVPGLLASACASGPPAPPVGVEPCVDASGMTPVELEIGEPAEDGVTWGPRFVERPVPVERARVVRVEMDPTTGRTTSPPRTVAREMGRTVARLVIDETGEIVARTIVENTGPERAAQGLLDFTGDFEFHPAQRDGCAIPSVVDFSMDMLR